MTRFLSYEFPQEDNTRRHVIPMDITEIDEVRHVIKFPPMLSVYCIT